MTEGLCHIRYAQAGAFGFCQFGSFDEVLAAHGCKAATDQPATHPAFCRPYLIPFSTADRQPQSFFPARAFISSFWVSIIKSIPTLEPMSA